MENDTPASQAVNRRIALLIDADNVSHSKIALMLAELSKYGTANIRRAYGDWEAQALRAGRKSFTTLPSDQSSNSAIRRARMPPILLS
jgi:hypothetical protein